MRSRWMTVQLATALMGLGLSWISPLWSQASEVREVLVVAQSEVPESRLLDVGIEVFNPGLAGLTDEQMEKEGIFDEVRKSEARFLPFQLKEVLESTGHWGAVRVVPRRTRALDLRVTGRILESNGFRLAVEIQATDASGKKWFLRRYKVRADERAYGVQEGEAGADPFEQLYVQVANDLQKKWLKLSPEEVAEIRTICSLQFASDMAPTVFGETLKTRKNGRVRVSSLPAEGDPMLARVNELRERDYLFVDTLNEHYETFVRGMGMPYLDWRTFSYEEQVVLRRVRRQARTATILGILGVLAGAASDNGTVAEAGVIAGSMAIQRGMQLRQESKIHVEALKELAASFDAEIAPSLVEVEGETVRLKGAAEAQFAQWRELLGRIFAAEMGLPLDLNAQSTAGGSGDPNRPDA